MSYWVAKELDAKTMLVAVPSLSLVRQSFQVWAWASLANNREMHQLRVGDPGEVEVDST